MGKNTMINQEPTKAEPSIIDSLKDNYYSVLMSAMAIRGVQAAAYYWASPLIKASGWVSQYPSTEAMTAPIANLAGTSLAEKIAGEKLLSVFKINMPNNPGLFDILKGVYNANLPNLAKDTFNFGANTVIGFATSYAINATMPTQGTQDFQAFQENLYKAENEFNNYLVNALLLTGMTYAITKLARTALQNAASPWVLARSEDIQILMNYYRHDPKKAKMQIQVLKNAMDKLEELETKKSKLLNKSSHSKQDVTQAQTLNREANETLTIIHQIHKKLTDIGLKAPPPPEWVDVTVTPSMKSKPITHQKERQADLSKSPKAKPKQKAKSRKKKNHSRRKHS